MPLKKGSSQNTISHNIEEMMKAYKESGKIGKTTPKNDEHARKIATAAAYKKAGKSKNKKKFKHFLESLINNENFGIIETLNKGFFVCMESISFDDAKRIAFDWAEGPETPQLHLFAETGRINDKEALSEEIEGNLNALIISEMDPMEKEMKENELMDLQDFVSGITNLAEGVTLKYTYKGQPVEVLKNKGMDEAGFTEVWTVKLPDGSSMDVKSRDLKGANAKMEAEEFMDTRTELESLQDLFSDMFKDVHGFRPRFATPEQWNSVEWLKKEVAELQKTPFRED